MVGTFVLVYLIQSMDKKYIKRNEEKLTSKNLFDIIKLPLLASAIVGLSTEYLFNSNSTSNSSPAFNQDIFTEVPNF